MSLPALSLAQTPLLPEDFSCTGQLWTLASLHYIPSVLNTTQYVLAKAFGFLWLLTSLCPIHLTSVRHTATLY